MNIIRKFTLASMKNNRRWTIVTAIGIIISVAMLSAIATLTSSFLSYMIENEKIDNGDWHVRLQHPDQNQLILKVEQPFVDTLSWQQVLGFIQIEDPIQSGKPYLQVTAMDSLGFTQQYVRVLEGRLPLAKGEIVMTEEQAKAYKVGEQITLNLSLRTLNGEIVPVESGFMRSYETEDDVTFIETAEQLEQAVEHQFKLVGIIEDSSKSYSSVINAYTFYDSALDAHYDPMVSIKLTPLRQSTLLAMTEAFKDSENMIMTVNNQLLRYYGMIGNQEIFTTLAGLIAIIVMIVMVASIALIYNSFSISLSQRTRQLGMLSSVGATRAQKRSNVFLEALYLSIFAIPVGLVLGILGISLTLIFVEPLFRSFVTTSATLKLVVWWQLLLVATLVSVITIALSVWIPALRASQISIMDSIMQRKDIKFSGRSIKTPRWIRWIFGLEGDLALKNLKRSKKKFRSTVISLTVSIVLFVSVNYFMSSLFSLAKVEYANKNYDLSVLLLDKTVESATTRIEKLRNSEYVDRFQSSRMIQARATYEELPMAPITLQLYNDGFIGKSLELYTIILDDISFKNYLEQINGDLSMFTKDSNNVIVLNIAKDSFNNKRYTGKVFEENPFTANVEITHSESGEITKNAQLNIVSFTDMAPLGYSYSMFYGVILITNQESVASLLDSELLYYNIFMESNNDQMHEIEIREYLNESDEVRFIMNNMKSEYRNISNTILVMEVFVYGFIILISLISVMNIINTITTNVQLRRKEFAMLRSVGMTPQSFDKMVRFESVFYGFSSLLFGFPISLLVIALINHTMADGFIVDVQIPYGSFVFVTLVIFTLVFITMSYSVARIRSDNIVDALKMDI
ncbi:MAG: FtsX-like permease family protein [Erysipelotrichaceae bacterium]|nr:FtsX-like permease family protein [Erysipelotrichaceae bacterium]